MTYSGLFWLPRLYQSSALDISHSPPWPALIEYLLFQLRVQKDHEHHCLPSLSRSSASRRVQPSKHQYRCCGLSCVLQHTECLRVENSLQLPRYTSTTSLVLNGALKECPWSFHSARIRTIGFFFLLEQQLDDRPGVNRFHPTAQAMPS